MTETETRNMRRAAADPDQYAVELTYTDTAGQTTQRQCSPIRRSSAGWLVMCFASGEPRLLSHSRIQAVKLLKAEDCLIPSRKISIQ